MCQSRKGQYIFVNPLFTRLKTYKFKFLDDLGGFVDTQDGACCRNTETWIGRREGLEAGEASVRGNQGSVESAEAVHVFRSVLEHPISCPGIRDGIDGESLESPPTQGENQGVASLDC